MSDPTVSPWPEVPPVRTQPDLPEVIITSPSGGPVDFDVRGPDNDLHLPAVALVRPGSLAGVSISDFDQATGQFTQRPDAFPSQWSEGVITSDDMPTSGPNPSRPTQTGG